MRRNLKKSGQQSRSQTVALNDLFEGTTQPLHPYYFYIKVTEIKLQIVMTNVPADPMVQNYLMWLEIEKGCSPNTIKGYGHDLKSLIEFLAQQRVVNKEEPINWGNITTFNLRSFLNHLYNDNNNKKSSIHRRVCSMKGFFKFLSENEVVKNNPAKVLSYPKRDKSLPKFLPTEEVSTLLTNAKKKATKKPTTGLHSAVLEVLYSTGARCSEIRNLDLDDISIEEREYITESGEIQKELRGQVMIRGGKGSKDRRVFLTHRAASVLRHYILVERAQTLEKARKRGKEISADAERALFLSNRAQRVANRTIQHFTSKMANDAGVRHTTPHMIRHSFASHLLMNQTNIRAIQKLLGHSSLDTTQIYANISDEYLRNEFDGNLPIK